MVLASRKVVFITATILCIACGRICGQPIGSQETPLTKARVMARSLLLPGLGEMSLGKNRVGKIFTGVEVGLWLVMAESYWSRNRYQSRLEAYAPYMLGFLFTEETTHSC